MSFRRGNQAGFSLVEVLVVAGMMGFMVMVLSSIVSSLSRESTSLKESLSRSDFDQQLIRAMADGTVCTKISAGKSFLVGGTPPSIKLSLAEIPVSALPGAGPLATRGKPISANSPSVVVDPTNPFEIVNISGSSSGGVGSYTANLVVNFDSNQLVQAIRPSSVQVILQTTSAGGVETVVGCAASSTPKSCHMVSNRGGAPSYVSHARCAANEYMLNGGGRCESPGSGLCASTSLGFLHLNSPDADMKGWTVDCFEGKGGGEACSEAWATCCTL
jgi:type II secretory pathway pseudopilin PulG